MCVHTCTCIFVFKHFPPSVNEWRHCALLYLTKSSCFFLCHDHRKELVASQGKEMYTFEKTSNSRKIVFYDIKNFFLEQCHEKAWWHSSTLQGCKKTLKLSYETRQETSKKVLVMLVLLIFHYIYVISHHSILEWIL